MKSSIEEAFHAVCTEAKEAKSFHCSLYRNIPFYGGAEEGGWWGNDTVLEASQEFPTEEAAEAAKLAVARLAVRLNNEARREYGQQCLRELEIAEAQGCDDANLIFGEVAGEDTYWVTVEETQGQSQQRGSRHYE